VIGNVVAHGPNGPNDLCALWRGVGMVEHMFEMRAAVIAGELDGLSVPASADAIVCARGLLDRLSALVADAERVFAAGEGWRDRGASSMSAWLHDEAGLSLRDARAASKRADRLGVWAEVRGAWLSGSLSGAQVDLLVGMVPARFVARMSDDASVVVRVLASLDAEQSARLIREWVAMVEADDGDDAFCDRPSGLYLSTTLGGRGVLDGDLDAESTAIVEAALRVFTRPDPPVGSGSLDAPRTLAQVRAEALVDLARFGLAHNPSGVDVGRHHPHVSLTVDLSELMAATLRGACVGSVADLDQFAAAHSLGPVAKAWFADSLQRVGRCETFDGVTLGPLATEVLTCDSVIQRVLTEGTEIIELGRSVRTATREQRRTVIGRDRHCRAPGCTRPAKYCDVHHIDHWIDGGRTDASRLVLLCSYHHHQFHKPGWHTDMAPSGELTVKAPDGRTRTTKPPGHGPPPFRRQRRPERDTRQPSSP
jgi:hypothetical protein